MKQSTHNEAPVNDEYAFELTRSHLIALISAPFLAGLAFYLTLPQGDLIAGAIAVTVLTAVLWISEALPLPVTALLIPIGMASVGVFEAHDAYHSFGSSILFLILGGYALAVAIEANGVAHWFARYILGAAGQSAFKLLVAFMLTAALISTLISNTATAALLLPMTLGILSRHLADANLSRLLLLGIAHGASIGGIATLTGTAPNAIVAGALDISFLQWLSYGAPISVAMLLAAIPILWFFYQPEQKQIEVNLGTPMPLTQGGKRALGVVAITFSLWLFGPMLGQWLGQPVLFSSASVASIAVLLLILSRCVNWKALEKGVNWGVLLLLGGGLSLGRGLTQSGAADWLAGLLSSGMGDMPMLILLLVVVSIGVFATELISNTATTANLVPILMGVALQLGLEVDTLAVPVAIAASMAFMLPVATPPNSLVHATGKVTQQEMIRGGFFLNLASISIITLFFYFEVAG